MHMLKLKYHFLFDIAIAGQRQRNFRSRHQVLGLAFSNNKLNTKDNYQYIYYE
jgi:hypothetical protein